MRFRLLSCCTARARSASHADDYFSERGAFEQVHPFFVYSASIRADSWLWQAEPQCDLRWTQRARLYLAVVLRGLLAVANQPHQEFTIAVGAFDRRVHGADQCGAR